MTQRSNSGKTDGRKGKGFFPPNPKQWPIEKNGLDLRHELATDLGAPLDHDAAYGLLPHVSVNPHGAIPAAAMFINHFRGAGAASWSGLAMTLDDGHELVFYNDSHPENRIRATLMEEFFHLRLGHARSTVRVFGGDGPGRTFDSKVEDEAYQSGAAALVPYWSLKRLADAGRSASVIAGQFQVSRDLVVFRAKVTRCYRVLTRRAH